jgi:hypothetical protein
MHQRDLTNNSSLPGISEDSDVFIDPQTPPPVPKRALNRPVNKGFRLGAPPVFTHENRPPPEYSLFDGPEAIGPNGEKLETVRKDFRNNKHIAKRGGWKKLVLIALVILLCLIGLIVGLVVGLQKENNGSSYGHLPISNTRLTKHAELKVTQAAAPVEEAQVEEHQEL